jgi:transposase-like protein
MKKPSVLTDLKARGVKDILIACVDGLKGFPEAIANIYPKTMIQLCIVHQIRASLRYMASKYQKEFTVDLKEIYRASSLESAETARRHLEEKWSEKYPAATSGWKNNWPLPGAKGRPDSQAACRNQPPLRCPACILP